MTKPRSKTPEKTDAAPGPAFLLPARLDARLHCAGTDRAPDPGRASRVASLRPNRAVRPRPPGAPGRRRHADAAGEGFRGRAYGSGALLPAAAAAAGEAVERRRDARPGPADARLFQSARGAMSHGD